MSTFKAGQRVRLARPLHPENKGLEGVFLSYSLSPFADCEVDWRGAWPFNVADSSQLEPITPSGHRSGDYSYTELMDRLKAGEVECV